MADESGLNIQLREQQPFYSPGDVVKGTVRLNLIKDSVIGKISVCFRGHAKSKILQPNGQSTSTFEGEAELFNLEKTLHDDHYTHKSGQMSWDFEFEIPEDVSRPEGGRSWTSVPGYMGTDGTDAHPLPPTFRFAESKSGKGWRASNVYSIEAMMVEPGLSQLNKSRGKHVIAPICVLPRPTDIPIDMDDPRQRRGISETFTIKSLRLLPENLDIVPVMQRARAAFNPSIMPKFTFDIDVSYSSVLQVHHPLPLPFVVAAIPNTDPQLTTIQPGMRTFYRYPTLKIKHFRLSLQATTMCRCPSVLSDTSASVSHNIILADRHMEDTVLGMRSLAWNQKNGIEEEVSSLIDFGKECDIIIAIDAQGSPKKDKKKRPIESSGGSNDRNMVAPSFTTYNVSRKYHLVWNIEFECAKEKMVLKGVSPEQITILGPAASARGDLQSENAVWMIEPVNHDDSEDDEDDAGSPRHPSSRDTLPAYSELPVIAAELSAEPTSSRRSTEKTSR